MEEKSKNIKKCIDAAEKELREKFNELLFDYGDNDGEYFLRNRTSGFNTLLEYARKWQKAKEAEEGGPTSTAAPRSRRSRNWSRKTSTSKNSNPSSTRPRRCSTPSSRKATRKPSTPSGNT